VGVASVKDAPVHPPKTKVTKPNVCNTAESDGKSDDKNNPPCNVSIVEQPNPEREAYERKRDNEHARNETLITWFTALLAIVASLQVFIIVWQIKSTEKSRIVELRAYLGISKIFLNMTNPTLPIAFIEVQNFGQTPAYKVRQWAKISPESYPLSGKLIEPESPLSSMAVLSRDMKHSNIVPMKKPVPIEAITVIGTPAWTVYVFGKVVYEDVFGIERHVSYRFIYGGPEGPKQIFDNNQTIGVMSPDTTGNESD